MDNSPLALITGANRGIGAATGWALAQAGFGVILTARDVSSIDTSLYKGCAKQGPVCTLQLDVTQVADLSNVSDWLSERSLHLSVLVNNAGILKRKPPDTHPKTPDISATSSDLIDYFNVNTLGPVRTIETLVPHMKNGARIINVSSRLGQLCEMQGGNLGYRITKTALNAVTKVYAAELNPVGISVYSLCPGWVRTDMGGANAIRSPNEAAEDIRWLATACPAPVSGRFYHKRKAIAW